MLLAAITLPLQSQVLQFSQSESREEIAAFGPSGPTIHQAAYLRVDMTNPLGKRDVGELTVLFDSLTGYYLWAITTLPADRREERGLLVNRMKARKLVAFADSGGLTEFSISSGLSAKTWRSRATSLTGAIAASIAEIQRFPASAAALRRDYIPIPITLPRKVKSSPVFTGVYIDFRIPANFKPIPQTFWCAEFNSFCPTNNNSIVSITKQGNNYRLIVRARFDAEVIVDQNLDVVSAQQLTQPAE